MDSAPAEPLAWDDWVEQDEPALCLFTDETFPSAQKCWLNASEKHGFNIEKLRQEWGLNDYLHIKLVNYLRATKQEQPDKVLEIASKLTNSSDAPWKSDKYLEPVLNPDPLLFIKGWSVHEGDSDVSDDEFAAPVEEASQELKALSHSELLLRLQKAERAVKELNATLHQQVEINKDLKDFTVNRLMGEKDDDDVPEVARQLTETTTKEKYQDHEHEYFEGCYGHFAIHSTMLKDRVRTDAYRDFIINNPQLFKDKVVMDVGCGTGILSMFAVTAGAKIVFAVDNSTIIHAARKNVIENGMQDKICLIKNKAELIEELEKGETKVDIIISEWMGYGLLFECMLESVLLTRDRWCHPGLMFPDIATMHLCAWSDAQYYGQAVAFWDSVYGYKMSAMKEAVLKEARVDVLPGAAIKDFSSVATIKHLDINTCKIEDLDFKSPFEIQISETKPLHGFVLYFDIAFEAQCTNPVRFSTGPHVQPTHWEQTLFNLKTPLEVQSGEVIEGNISFQRGKDNHRSLDIKLNFEIKGKGTKHELAYTL